MLDLQWVTPLVGPSTHVHPADYLVVTVQWYLKEEQPVIQAIWQSMFGVATAVSSLLA